MDDSNLLSEWELAKERFPIGIRVRGVVSDHEPFGAFVDIGDAIVTGLILITDMVDEGSIDVDQFPAIGTSVEAVVVGYQHSRWKNYRGEIGLSIKLSVLCRSE